jgi:hypothetical protein
MSKITRIPVSDLPRGVPGLVRWIKRTNPRMYAELSDRLDNYGLGVADPNADPVTTAAAKPALAQTILSSVKDLLAVGLPLYQQNKLFELQIKRAEQDKPPLDASKIADGSAMRFGADSSTQNTVLIVAGIGAAALLGFAFLRRK